MPPWLRRTNGKKLILGLGDVFDAWAQNAADGAKMRFPTATVDADALAYTGRERRIERGPGEDAETYASRLRIWLDSHRVRGGTYALLAQLRAYWLTTLDVPIDVVNYSGGRYQMAADGTITRDVISWSADGSGAWAQDWIFFHLTGLPATIVDDAGNTFVTDGGASIIADVVSGGALTPEEEASFALVPRTWTAAHLKRCTVVLLFELGRLWDYPTPVPTWQEWADSGATWGEPDPAIIVIDF
jgi:hypothetical protein